MTPVRLLRGEAEQLAFGRALGAALSGRLLIFLDGDLGAGKTTLVRGLLRALGHRGPVRSPTYTLIESYSPPGGVCHHLDLYRLGDPEELEYLGLRELLAEEALVLIEWPQRGAGWLPEPDLWIRLSLAESGVARKARLEGRSAAGRDVVMRLFGA